MFRNTGQTCTSPSRLLVPFDKDGSFDKIRYGEMVQQVFATFLNTPLDWRAGNPGREDQIVDCLYQDLFADPIAKVRAIYDKFGMEYTQAFEDRMQVYLENNKQGKYGRHRYTNEEYGLDPDRLYADNKAYYDKYGYGALPEGHD